MALLLKNYTDNRRVDKDFTETRNLKTASFDDILSSSTTFAKRCFDCLANKIYIDEYYNIYFAENDGLFYSAHITYYAFSQLCCILEISPSFILKLMVDNHNDIASKIVNDYFSAYDKPLLIRCFFLDNNEICVRGIVSNSFSKIPTATILSSISKSVDLSQFSVNGYINDSERFQLRLTSKTLLDKTALQVGDKWLGGLILDNSEVGQSALNLRFFSYRLACTNGLIVSEFLPDFVYHIPHRGDIDITGIINGFSVFSTASKMVDEMLVATKQDTEWNIKSESAFSNENSLSKNFLLTMKKPTGLSNKEIEEIEHIMIVDYGMFNQRYALMNAITQFAHTGLSKNGVDIEKRTVLERYAGKLLIGV